MLFATSRLNSAYRHENYFTVAKISCKSYDSNLGSNHAAKMGDKVWRMLVVKVIDATNKQTSPQNDVIGKTH